MFCHNKEHLCNRIDATTLIDRMNEWMQESKDELHATQANLTEDPNQCSEDPKAKCCNYVVIICPGASKFSGVDCNHSCMFLGTHVLNTRG